GGAPVDVHPDPLVEALRARVALGVDAEADRALPAPPERPERVVEQRLADAAAAPLSTGEEPRNPGDSQALRATDRARDDLVAVTDDRPELRCEVVAVDHRRAPLLERLRLVLPVVCERGLEGGMELGSV